MELARPVEGTRLCPLPAGSFLGVIALDPDLGYWLTPQAQGYGFAREAADRGYGVTLVEDACGTTHEDLHHNTMRNFQRLFGRVRSTAESLAELGAAHV